MEEVEKSFEERDTVSLKRAFKYNARGLYSKSERDNESFILDSKDKIIPIVDTLMGSCGSEVLNKSIVFISDELIYKDLFRLMLIRKFHNRGIHAMAEIDSDVLELEDLYSIYLGKKFRKGGYLGKVDIYTGEEFDYEYLGEVIRKHLCILVGEYFQISLENDKYDGLLLYVFRRNFDAGNLCWIFFLGERIDFYRLYRRTCEFLLKLGVTFYDLREGKVLQREDLYKDVKIGDFYNFS